MDEPRVETRSRGYNLCSGRRSQYESPLVSRVLRSPAHDANKINHSLQVSLIFLELIYRVSWIYPCCFPQQPVYPDWVFPNRCCSQISLQKIIQLTYFALRTYMTGKGSPKLLFQSFQAMAHKTTKWTQLFPWQVHRKPNLNMKRH